MDVWLYVNIGSSVRPRIFGCVAMGSAVLFIDCILKGLG